MESYFYNLYLAIANLRAKSNKSRLYACLNKKLKQK